jgi:two-component system, OmpR family, alkaline phosphatase synthesis response regulator PhoP
MSPAILIVEDEQSIAGLIKERLDEEGYQVTVAYTGEEAVRDIKLQKPDVITLDIYLPDANGIKMLENIKANPETRMIPVIIISSSDEGEDAKGKGAEEFIRKPINFKKLMETIKGIENKPT